MTWLWLLASYLLGAIPSSYLAGRVARGIDLREHGSGNLGATNAYRVLGGWVAAPVTIFDVAKGFVPTWYFPLWDGAAQWEWALLYGAAAIVGHVFPIYTRFCGGKGIATATGVFLALAPAAVGTAIVIWLGVLLLFRMVSLASIAGALTLMLMLPVHEPRLAVVALGVAIGTFVIYAHRANIGRIMRGEEHRFGRGHGAPDHRPPPSRKGR